MNSTPKLINQPYSTILECRSCGSKNLRLLIDYGIMPLAGGFMKDDEVATKNIGFPLRLARCEECTLMQVMDTVPPEQIFTQYSYASSTTRTLVQHFAEMGPEIVRYSKAEGKLIVEFGCNDGVLVRPMIQAGSIVIGVDPSDVALRASQSEGWPLIHDYFTENVAKQILEQHGPAQVITGNNVFAHVPNIHEILQAITSLLEKDGLFIFEVHYQGALIETVQFDTVYHEHIFYYSVKALDKLLSFHGMRIIDILSIPIHAGSIRVYAAMKGSKWTRQPEVDVFLRMEEGLDVNVFVQKVQSRKVTINKFIGDLNRAGKRIAAYGAAGRMTIMLNFCELGPSLIEYVQDMSPLRYGRIVPGVLIPIVSNQFFHENPPDYAIMTAWNYEKEIIAKEQQFLKRGGRFIVPLPEVRIVAEV